MEPNVVGTALWVSRLNYFPVENNETFGRSPEQVYASQASSIWSGDWSAFRTFDIDGRIA